MAQESVVLLKNRLETLPLKKKSGTIAVVGPLADSQRDVMGSWSAAGVANQSVTVLAGIQNAVGDGAKILYAKGANITNDKDIVDFLNLYEEAVKIDPRSPQAMIDEAVQAAKQADVVVAVVGESQGMAHEASSRTNITIPQSQRDLITALKATGKPLVLVLMNGRPLALVKEDQQADAILELVCRDGRRQRHCRCAVWRLQPVRQTADLLPAFGGTNSGLLQPSQYGTPV